MIIRKIVLVRYEVNDEIGWREIEVIGTDDGGLYAQAIDQDGDDAPVNSDWFSELIFLNR